MSKEPSSLDPALAELLGDLEGRRAEPAKRRTVEAPLPTRKELKKEKERRKIQQRMPNRATYDLPEGMKQEIADIAEEHETTASQVAALLLYYGLKQLKADKIDLEVHKVPSESLRYEWNLRIE